MRSRASVQYVKKYYLSIPYLISQIKGITKDITGKRFFKIDNSKPKIREEIEKSPVEPVLRWLLSPAEELSEFTRVQSKHSQRIKQA